MKVIAGGVGQQVSRGNQAVFVFFSVTSSRRYFLFQFCFPQHNMLISQGLLGEDLCTSKKETQDVRSVPQTWDVPIFSTKAHVSCVITGRVAAFPWKLQCLDTSKNHCCAILSETIRDLSQLQRCWTECPNVVTPAHPHSKGNVAENWCLYDRGQKHSMCI